MLISMYRILHNQPAKPNEWNILSTQSESMETDSGVFHILTVVPVSSWIAQLGCIHTNFIHSILNSTVDHVEIVSQSIHFCL